MPNPDAIGGGDYYTLNITKSDKNRPLVEFQIEKSRLPLDASNVEGPILSMEGIDLVHGNYNELQEAAYEIFHGFMDVAKGAVDRTMSVKINDIKWPIVGMNPSLDKDGEKIYFLLGLPNYG